MKKITIKTVEALSVYNILNASKLGELENADMVKALHLLRALKPIATKYDDECKDALEKLKPNDGEFDQKLQKFYDYNNMVRNLKADMKNLPMGAAEHEDFKKNVWEPYQARVNEALKESANKKNILKVETISEEALGKLSASNDWTGAQLTAVSELIT
ncbi:hypothetical protein SAMN05216354_0351 [Xylanibacter ruminicola]|uniref:Uncharacterized protein n=1 Tax=Xylanibacter ruminicola TaxID=839 RepID=A0A1H5RX47_XYLRU|nr:hypothetical protein [Xylanibacter ruminicola]SEF42187.1 hypothetical protein SAMN05216354_0351 [Xylanibacter ruminicola]